MSYYQKKIFEFIQLDETNVIKFNNNHKQLD